MEAILTALFKVALDKLVEAALTQSEKAAISSALAKLAADYASGKEVDISELKPVAEMDLDALIEAHLRNRG